MLTGWEGTGGTAEGLDYSFKLAINCKGRYRIGNFGI